MKVSQVRHPLESLGLVRIERGDIRVERLSARTKPAVPFPHRHDFYQLLWMQRGSGWHEIDFHKYSVGAGQMFVMKPGQVHNWSFSNYAEGIIVEFSSESLKKKSGDFALENHLLRFPDLVTVKPPVVKSLGLLINEMLQEFEERGASFQKILESYLSILILQLGRSVKGAKAMPIVDSEALIVKFKNMVEENFKTEHGLEYYSKLLELSPRALTMRITRSLKRSGRDVIFERLILEAKRMLVYTDETIAHIGFDLGFDDANHFSRFFKIQTGQTAQNFRAKNRNK